MEPGSGKVKVFLGALCAAAGPSALLGQQRGPRPGRGLCSGQRARERESEGGRRARPGPSCPYDRAERRRALPSHGKRRPWRGALAGLGWELGGAARPLGARCPGAPTAEALPPRQRAPVSIPSLRMDCARPLALWLGPEAALQLQLGLRHSLGKGKTAHPIAWRGTLSHPLARERGSQPRGSGCVPDSLPSDQPLPRDRRSGCALRVVPSQWAFLMGHTHASRFCWGVGASGWGKFRGHPAYRMPRQKEGAGQATTCSGSQTEAVGHLGGWIKYVLWGAASQSCMGPALNLPAKPGLVRWGDPGLGGGRGGGRKVWGCRTVDRGSGLLRTAWGLSCPNRGTAPRWLRVAPLMNSKWSSNGFASEES